MIETIVPRIGQCQSKIGLLAAEIVRLVQNFRL